MRLISPREHWILRIFIRRDPNLCVKPLSIGIEQIRSQHIGSVEVNQK